MSVKLFRPKTVTLAAALITASIYYGSFGDKDPVTVTESMQTAPLESPNLEPVVPGAGEVAKPLTEAAPAESPSEESQAASRSPAFIQEENAQTVESSPDFFQSGKLDLNLSYILEKDAAFLEQNARLAELIKSGQKVRAEDINVPAGFHVSLRLEPQCSPATESIFQLEELDDNAKTLLASGNPAYVGARTKSSLSGNDLAKALQADNCISAAGAELQEEPGAVSFQAEPLTSSSVKKGFQIMRNAGLVDLFSMISYSTFGNTSVTFGVVDSGVNTSHPDLRSIATGDRDDFGHGTMVAGTAAAPSNGIGSMGSMPFHVKVRSFKINQPGQGSAMSSSISNGILRATYENIDVINVSWSGFSKGSYRSAIAAAVSRGSVVTGSGGNSSLKVYTNVTVPGAIAVGALNGTNNGMASYSNYGPGVEIYTPGTYMTTMKSGSYAVVSGTSFAAPLVGGIALMIKAYAKAHGQSVSPAAVEQMIMSTASTISTSRGYVRKMQPMAVFQRMMRTFL